MMMKTMKDDHEDKLCVGISSPERGAGLFLKCGAHSTSSRPCCCKGYTRDILVIF